jgi:hypothetical protein
VKSLCGTDGGVMLEVTRSGFRLTACFMNVSNDHRIGLRPIVRCQKLLVTQRSLTTPSGTVL